MKTATLIAAARIAAARESTADAVADAVAEIAAAGVLGFRFTFYVQPAVCFESSKLPRMEINWTAGGCIGTLVLEICSDRMKWARCNGVANSPLGMPLPPELHQTLRNIAAAACGVLNEATAANLNN
jgi:hypothetical protein